MQHIETEGGGGQRRRRTKKPLGREVGPKQLPVRVQFQAGAGVRAFASGST